MRCDAAVGSGANAFVPHHTHFGLVQVFLSLPCVMGRAGVTSAVNIDLTEAEQVQLRHSADTVNAVQRQLQQLGSA